MTYEQYCDLIGPTRRERKAIERAANHRLAFIQKPDDGEEWERETADHVLGEATDNPRRWSELSYAVLLLSNRWLAEGRKARTPPMAEKTRQELATEARADMQFTESEIAYAMDMLTAGMTREHVAREIGCHPDTLSRWQRRRAA